MLGKKMAGRNDRLVGGYYRKSFSAAGESEGSGSSGRIDAEFTGSEDMSIPSRKCISLNSNKGSVFFVPSEVLPTSSMTPSERRALIHRLKLELQQIQILQKKLESQRINTVAVSSSSDILRSCSNGQPKSDATRKAAPSTSIQEKKVKSLGNKGPPFKQRSSGKTDPTKEAVAPKAAEAVVMTQCETLLKRLMSHQYSWVFNKPVDVKGLNIPDYLTVIKHPMDLGTVKGKISSGGYSSPLEFAADVRLVFANAMTYNPPGNDVHLMADTLNKFFEVRWKPIGKKLAGSDSQSLQAKSGPSKEIVATTKPLPPAKKRKISSIQYEAVPEPTKPVMTDEEKHNLGRQLESIMEDMPERIIDFLRENSSNGRECGEEEIEIDIDDLSNDTLFTLRKLLDEHLQEKQKSQARDEQCELEILTESGFSNSSVQPVNGDEDVDIGGNEPPVSSYPLIKKENGARQQATIGISENGPSDSDLSSSSDSESDRDEASSPKHAQREAAIAEVQMGEKQSPGSPLDVNQPISVLDQLDQASLQQQSSLEPDNCQDGENAPNERQASPGKLYRAALLKSRFADTILKAREKTLSQGDKRDTEKLRREREELEMQRNREKARLQAEAKAAEDACRQLEAEAVAEAKRKRELEREAARQALLKMEKTVEINENSRFLEDLEVLSTIPVEQLPSSADETSPDNNALDRLGSFKFEGSNPLEQLGLFMKADDDEEEAEPPIFSNLRDEVEEGEID